MALNLTQLRKMVWKPCGMDDENDTDLPSADIDLYLNRSFWEVQDKFPFREKEKTATFMTVAGDRDYSVPSPVESLVSLAIVDSAGKHIELNQITHNIYEDNYQEGEDYYGFPVDYELIECYARLLPTPDDAYKIVMKRLVILDDLSNSNATPTIPQVWHEIIGYGGAWRALLDLGDHAKARDMRTYQVALINSLSPREVKEKSANTQTAGLEVIRNDYLV